MIFFLICAQNIDCTSNKDIKMSSFKGSENIQKKEGRPDRSVSDYQSSSVTLNELAMKARKDTFDKWAFLLCIEVFPFLLNLFLWAIKQRYLINRGRFE